MVQKHKEIGDADAEHLRSLNLIDGVKPNFFVSSKYNDARNGPISDVRTVTNNVVEVNDTQRKIIEAIRANPTITMANLASYVGIDERNIKRNMKLLKDSGAVKREGSSRKGHWTIATDTQQGQTDANVGRKAV
jgi:predicted HTH transcriptional regulator